MTEADQWLPRDGGRKKGCRGGITKGYKETWGDRDVHNLDCGDDFMDVNICQNLSNYTHLSAVYCMQLHLNKTILRNCIHGPDEELRLRATGLQDKKTPSMPFNTFTIFLFYFFQLYPNHPVLLTAFEYAFSLCL